MAQIIHRIELAKNILGRKVMQQTQSLRLLIGR
jgi:hypothetical protein